MDNMKSKYVFYFFSHFKPNYPFIEITVNGDNWGRYDKLSLEQYGTPDYWWVVQLFDTKEHFFNMEYDYNLFLPQKIDIDEYVRMIDELFQQ